MRHDPTEEADRFGKRIGGRLCLDFVNTVRARTPGGQAAGGVEWLDRVQGERLDSYQALAHWARAAGAITPAEAAALLHAATARPAEAREVHARARVAREAIYRIFKAELEGWGVPAVDLDTLNRELRLARVREQLVAGPQPRWAWEDDPAALDRMLWPVIRSAAELLTAPELRRVRQCPGNDCGWLFLDTSRSGRRRWCDMADCGNVAKVRRFRSRRKRAEG